MWARSLARARSKRVRRTMVSLRCSMKDSMIPLSVKSLRLVVGDGQELDAEGGLHLGELVEGLEDDVGDLAPAQLQHHADALAARLVSDVRDAGDALLAHQLGDLGDEVGLVDLVGHLRDDDGLPVLPVLLDVGPGPHPDQALAGLVGLPDALAAQDEPGRGEVGAGDEAHEFGAR